MSSFKTMAFRDSVLTLLDQTKLPTEEVYVDLTQVEQVARAIETMVVRGAPAIGIVAAFGITMAEDSAISFEEADVRLRRTRPTAVNLFWALDRMKRGWAEGMKKPELQEIALKIYQEEVDASKKMGVVGAERVPDNATILTHCNAGALATAEHGTALAVIREAHRQGKKIRVLADETRPVLQGARLTAWELQKDGIDVTVIPDGAVAHFLSKKEIDLTITGADRIAANGDAANKIGTRGVACLMRFHEKPFYIAAPWSTVDMSMESGADVEIEERHSREVTHVGDTQVVPDGVPVFNPAFDITPADWIWSIFTDRGEVGPGNLREGLGTMDL